MSQTKRHSFYESMHNILIGYLVAVGSQLVVFPLFDVNIPLWDNFLIGAYFTVISLIRSYMVRRFWNKKVVKV